MTIVDTLTALVARTKSLLTEKEPVTAITITAVAVAWLATHGAYALGIAHNPPPALDAIQGAVSAAVLALNLFLRQITYSPATVAIIQAAAASAGVQAATSGTPATVAVTTAPAVVASATVTPAPDDPDPNADPAIPEDTTDAVPADPPAADAPVSGTGDS